MNIYLIIGLSILPLFYKFFFWLYTIQLKEYRFDRFKEYLNTKQWKKALFNLFSKLEFLIFIIFSILFFTKYNFLIDLFFIWYLTLLNLFVFYKILKKNILKPKFTFRSILLAWLFIFWFVADLYFLINYWYENFISFYILIIFLTIPLIIFICNIITLPIVNYKKNKIIKKAIEKSKKINNPPIKIAITWSYGKSSIKEFLSSILEKKFNILKTPENINTELWVSSIVLNKLSDKYDYFIAEIWAYRIWEISTLWKIVNHKYGFISAIWNQHLWLFWWIENTKKAKFEIIEKVIENKGILYINCDNKNIQDYVKNINYKNIVKYGILSKDADAKSTILKQNLDNTEFSFSYKWIEKTYKTNLVWEHNILNLTWILAFCIDQNIEIQDKDLLSIKKPKNTQEIIKHWNLTLIDDSYNLSYEWLLSWLELIKDFKWEKILVLDDILELGNKADQIHKNLWKILNKKIDKILLVWVNYKDIIIKSLLKEWFDKKNIINNLNEIKSWIILFEWRWTKKYLDNIKK